MLQTRSSPITVRSVPGSLPNRVYMNGYSQWSLASFEDLFIVTDAQWDVIVRNFRAVYSRNLLSVSVH